MNWQPLLDALSVFIAGVLVAMCPFAPVIGVQLIKRLRIDIAAKRLEAYSAVYERAVAYGNQLKRDPHYPTVQTGPDAQKAAEAYAKAVTEFVNLPEPDWDLRRMLSDAEYGRNKDTKPVTAVIQSPNVTISPSQAPPPERNHEV